MTARILRVLLIIARDIVTGLSIGAGVFAAVVAGLVLLDLFVR